jgi:periplasmic protein TonB
MVDRTRPRGSFRGGTASSVAIHAAVAMAFFVVLHTHANIAAYKLPGTAQGVHFLTYYAPGSVHATPNEVAAKAVEKQASKLTMQTEVAQAKADPVLTPSAEKGIGNAGESGAGEGNITIALEKYFPYPKPSLETLPAGSAGDVVLNAVIDEHGKIAQLTVVHGLGPAIDDAVIATVNQWVYTPAMKDGVPVPSVEELHFHYERRA